MHLLSSRPCLQPMEIMSAFHWPVFSFPSSYANVVLGFALAIFVDSVSVCSGKIKKHSKGAKLGWDGYSCYNDDDYDVEHTCTYSQSLASPIAPVCVIDNVKIKKKKRTGNRTSQWQKTARKTKTARRCPHYYFSAYYELLACKT